MAADFILRTENLTRRFAGFTALHDVSVSEGLHLKTPFSAHITLPVPTAGNRGRHNTGLRA